MPELKSTESNLLPKLIAKQTSSWLHLMLFGLIFGLLCATLYFAEALTK